MSEKLQQCRPIGVKPIRKEQARIAATFNSAVDLGRTQAEFVCEHGIT